MHTIPVRPFVTFKLLTLVALGLALLLLSGCHYVGEKGNGDVVTENRSLGAFTRIEADGAFEVNWTNGAQALTITTDKNLLEYIQTRIDDDTLRIEWVKPLKGTRGIKINIASPALTRVQLNGAVRFVGSNLSGSEFYLEANGATRVALHGNVNAMSAEMNGASRLDAESLITRAIEIAISGAGRAEVHATEALKVEIAGAARVIYSGDPKTVSRDISGAASVKKRGE